jgi:hypothetical protein
MKWFWGSGSLSKRLAWTCFAALSVALLAVEYWDIGLR